MKSRNVQIWYLPTQNVICLALKDKAGYWKWFHKYRDFVHMDYGPKIEGFTLIGTFKEKIKCTTQNMKE